MPIKSGTSIEEELDEGLFLPIPLELVEDFICVDNVIWTSNPDGTYTIAPYINDN